MTAISVCLLLGGCSNHPQPLNETKQGSVPSTVTVSSSVQSVPPNFVTIPVPDAAKIPIKYYSLLSKGNFVNALQLGTPFFQQNNNSSELTGYYKNIEGVKVVQFKDITSTWGGMPIPLDNFYAVKVYIAVVDFKVKDPSIAYHNVGKKLKRLFVVKMTKDSPWQLFIEQGYSRYFVDPSWGLNLQGVTDPKQDP